MSVSSTARKAGPYTSNGSQTQFAFAFKLFLTSEIVVTKTDLALVETTLVLTTDYTVSLNADQNANPGGTVTLNSAVPSNYLITLTSGVAQSQSLTLTLGGGFYPTVIADALDRVTILVQQLAEQVSRAVKVNVSSSQTPDDLMADIATQVAAAGTYASNASASASAAAASASSASTQASNAATSASNASSSASAASSSASSAATQASNAATSATNAANTAASLGILTPTVKSTGPYTAGNGDLVDCTVSGLTINTPATPSAGWRFAVRCRVQGTTTVGRTAGVAIMGDSGSDFTISTPMIMCCFTYVDATTGWAIT